MDWFVGLFVGGYLVNRAVRDRRGSDPYQFAFLVGICLALGYLAYRLTRALI